MTSADLQALLQAGRLSQRCEPSGITEAAGGYCTSCGRRTGPADWFRQGLSEAQRAARQAKGRDRAENGATAAKSAPPEPLGLWSSPPTAHVPTRGAHGAVPSAAGRPA